MYSCSTYTRHSAGLWSGRLLVLVSTELFLNWCKQYRLRNFRYIIISGFNEHKNRDEILSSIFKWNETRRFPQSINLFRVEWPRVSPLQDKEFYCLAEQIFEFVILISSFILFQIFIRCSRNFFLVPVRRFTNTLIWSMRLGFVQSKVN